MKGSECGRHAQASMICATKYLSSLVSFLTIGAILIEPLGCKGQAIFSSSPKNLTGTGIKDGLNNPDTWGSEVQLSLRNNRSQVFKDFQDSVSHLCFSLSIRVSITAARLSPHGGSLTTTNSQRFSLSPSSPEEGKHSLSGILRFKFPGGRLTALAWDRCSQEARAHYPNTQAP